MSFTGREPTLAPCTLEEFKCTNGHCVSLRYVCDHNDNCGDRTDEMGCSKCHNKRLIQLPGRRTASSFHFNSMAAFKCSWGKNSMNPLGRVMMVFSRSFNKRFTVFWFRQKNEYKHYIDRNKNKCIVQSVGNMAWIYV